MRIGKYIGLFFIQIVLTFVTVFVVLAFINVHIDSAKGPMDSISLANTFMVFVTFILVAITLVITMASIWFAKTFSEKKVDIIKDNIKEIVEALLKNKNLKDDVFKEIIQQANVKKLLQEHIEKLTNAQKADFDRELGIITKNLNDEISNIKKSVETIIDKRLKDSDKVNELNELFGGKK